MNPANIEKLRTANNLLVDVYQQEPTPELKHLIIATARLYIVDDIQMMLKEWQGEVRKDGE